jgi:putative restriction endonuclease
VNRRFKEEFDNGRHSYDLHGQTIPAPEDALRRPDPEALRWHNERS